MSLDKAIKHGKEKRKPYLRRGKNHKSCRPNGGCPYCESSRLHRDRKASEIAQEKLREALLKEARG